MTSEYDHRQYGYARELTVKDQQRGFVLHQRHIFLCHGNRSSWPADFVIDGPDSLPARLISALNSYEDQIKRKTILTICEPSGDASLKEGDVLIFPDMIKYRLTPSGVDSFVKEVLVRDELWSRSRMKSLRKGHYLFVCAHGSHDKRSGICGQLVLQKLNQMVEANNFGEKVFPIPCSDIGAPESAANLIIFARDANQQVDGHWYTYVCPNDIPCIIFSHFVIGYVHSRRWRGKLGNEKILALDDYPPMWWMRAHDDDFVCCSVFHEGDLMVGWDSLKQKLFDPAKVLEQVEEDLLPLRLFLRPIDEWKAPEPWASECEMRFQQNVEEEAEREWGECASEMQNFERPSREEAEREQG